MNAPDCFVAAASCLGVAKDPSTSLRISLAFAGGGGTPPRTAAGTAALRTRGVLKSTSGRQGLEGLTGSSSKHSIKQVPSTIAPAADPIAQGEFKVAPCAAT